MFRILVVEDELDVLGKVCARIRKGVLGAVVDSAETVLEANDAIDRILSDGNRYDCAVLDFKLPTGRGDERIDVDLCRRLRVEMKDIGVIHITSATQDRQVVEHIRSNHAGPSVRACALVDKSDINFFNRTLGEVREFLYTKFVEEELGYWFSTNETRSGESSVTTRLQRLERALVQMWPNLAEYTKDLVKRRFDVNEELSPITITLK